MTLWPRREMLFAGGGALFLAACGSDESDESDESDGSTASTGLRLVGPTDPAVDRRDARRRKPGAKTVVASITAAATTVSIRGGEVPERVAVSEHAALAWHRTAKRHGRCARPHPEAGWPEGRDQLPGQWMLHCHNTYHLETGMATVFSEGS